MPRTAHIEALSDKLTLWASPIPRSAAAHSPPGCAPQWLSAPERAEWATFATCKRADEFRAGRHLLRQALAAQGCRIDALSIGRDSYGAPVLQGPLPLPSFSICHCGGFVGAGWSLVLTGPPGCQLGVDAEPLVPAFQPSILNVMARGAERDALAQAGSQAQARAWVIKECVQKALGLGMYIDPRAIDTRSTPLHIYGCTVDVQVHQRWGLLISIGTVNQD